MSRLETLDRRIEPLIPTFSLTDVAELIKVSAAQCVDDVLKHAALLGDELPFSMRSAIHDFRLIGNGVGMIRITHVPIDFPLVNTPQDQRELPSLPVAELSLTTVMSRFGSVVGYRQEAGGRITQHIFPTPRMASTQTSLSSKVGLMFHTEAAFHPHKPDYLGLLCLRSDHERKAKTTIAHVDLIVERFLSSRALEILRQPRFRTGIDESYGNLARSPANGPLVTPIFGPAHDLGIIADCDLMRAADPLDHEAEAALNELNHAIERARIGVALRPGDLVVIDNRRCCHGRSSFTPRFDGFDRWLLRSFAVTDISRSASVRKPLSQVIETYA